MVGLRELCWRWSAACGLPGPGGQRLQEVRTVSTMTAALLALGDWLASLGMSRVVMEATSDYWRAPFYLLEDRFRTWLVNAHDVKHLPGRPKTDRLDAVWLCTVAERGDAAPVLRAAAGDPAAARSDPLQDGGQPVQRRRWGQAHNRGRPGAWPLPRRTSGTVRRRRQEQAGQPTKAG
jgi:Transposase